MFSDFYSFSLKISYFLLLRAADNRARRANQFLLLPQLVQSVFLAGCAQLLTTHGAIEHRQRIGETWRPLFPVQRDGATYASQVTENLQPDVYVGSMLGCEICFLGRTPQKTEAQRIFGQGFLLLCIVNKMCQMFFIQVRHTNYLKGAWTINNNDPN